MVITLLDLNQIKTFIYAAPTLRAIRGSSSMLAEFNDHVRVKRRVENHKGSFIYAGGGSVLAEFQSTETAEAFIDSERNLLDETTRKGATFTYVTQEVADEDEFGEAVLKAQRRLIQAKAQRVHTYRLPQHFLLKPCQSCAISPAVVRNTLRSQLVCATCDEKIQRGGLVRSNRQRLIEPFLSKAGTAWQDAGQADDLEALAASSRNYIAVIQADGNAMGERLRYLAEHGDTRLFTEFSRACREAVENALLQALCDAYPKPNWVKGGAIVPFELVIVGGDDVTIITTADRAIQIAIDFCDGFTRQMDTFAKTVKHPDLAVGMSAGVIFAHSNYPIALLDDIAGQLLKSAKARSIYASDRSLMPTIDFMVVTAANAGDVKRLRETTYCNLSHGKNSQRLTQRPYTVHELRKLVRALQYMKYPGGDIQPFPRNKLHDLYEIAFRDRDLAELEYLLLRGRLACSDKNPKKPHQEMLRELAKAGGMEQQPTGGPWRELTADHLAAPPGAEYDADTNLTDAVELYDFVTKSTSASPHPQSEA